MGHLESTEGSRTQNLVMFPSEKIRGGCQAILTGCVLMQYSAKLLKKPDQCRAVYNCSHLFWQDQEKGTRDGERWVMPCKKKPGSRAGSLCKGPVIRASLVQKSWFSYKTSKCTLGVSEGAIAVVSGRTRCSARTWEDRTRLSHKRLKVLTSSWQGPALLEASAPDRQCGSAASQCNPGE
jgi:hypothetical protein